MKKLVSVVLAVFWIFIFAVFISQWARAETIKGRENSCGGLAYTAAIIAQVRDGGAAWDDIKKNLLSAVMEAMNTPDSYVHDMDDVRTVMTLAESVMSSTSTPREIYQKVVNMCMKAQSKNT